MASRKNSEREKRLNAAVKIYRLGLAESESSGSHYDVPKTIIIICETICPSWSWNLTDLSLREG